MTPPSNTEVELANKVLAYAYIRGIRLMMMQPGASKRAVSRCLGIPESTFRRYWRAITWAVEITEATAPNGALTPTDDTVNADSSAAAAANGALPLFVDEAALNA